MSHPLEKEYGLTAAEILDAVSHHFRAKVALEGVVSETIMKKKLEVLEQSGAILRFKEIDQDGQPDFLVWVAGRKSPIRIECKNVRDQDEAYRKGGAIVAYKVEAQKTRAAKGDPLSRYYDADYFDILAVCLGKKTKRWSDFMFVRTRDLDRHRQHPRKLAVMHRVPLPETTTKTPWSSDLGEVIDNV